MGIETAGSSHPEERDLENYALGRFPEAQVARLEEHLLVCEACRRQLELTDAYVRGMRQAGARIRRQAATSGGTVRLLRLVPVAAAVLILLGIAIALRPRRSVAVAPATVMLEAKGGGGVVAQVPAGKPVLLKPGMEGLPSFPEYHLEILDRTAKRVWEGNFARLAGASVPEQPPGLYFVRLYSIPGAMLREYAMEVKPLP